MLLKCEMHLKYVFVCADGGSFIVSYCLCGHDEHGEAPTTRGVLTSVNGPVVTTWGGSDNGGSFIVG